MPNWCSNSFTVRHEDSAMIERFVNAFKAGTLFQEFIPLSSGEWDYNTAVEEWGTKWDISDGDIDVNSDGKSATGWFETAWSPAIEAYSKLTDLGFELDVLYHEPGMAYAGHYTSTDGDYSVEYDFSNKDWRKRLEEYCDSDLLDLLDSEYDSYLMWNEEEESK